jgi:hypothetical protein
MSNRTKVLRCCICHATFKGHGNNPWPVVAREVLDEDAGCCGYCNGTAVVPARFLARSLGAKTSAEFEIIARVFLAAPSGASWEDVKKTMMVSLEAGRAV